MNLQAVRVLQILMALATVLLVYRLGRRVFNHDVACYAAGVFWLYPSLVFFNFTILTETLFTFLLVALRALGRDAGAGAGRAHRGRSAASRSDWRR